MPSQKSRRRQSRRRGGRSSPSRSASANPSKTKRFVKYAVMGALIGLGLYLVKHNYISQEQLDKSKNNFDELKALVGSHLAEIPKHVDKVTAMLVEYVKPYLSKKDLSMQVAIIPGKGVVDHDIPIPRGTVMRTEKL